MHGMWRARFECSGDGSGTLRYLIAGWRARTAAMAFAVTQELHVERLSRSTHPELWRGYRLVELTFLPVVLSRERAVAWVALQKSGAITEHGWPLAAERGERRRDETWRMKVSDLHARLREQVIGFAASLAGITGTLHPALTNWAVAPHTDQFGRVDWCLVRDDIHRAACPGCGRRRTASYGSTRADQPALQAGEAGLTPPSRR
jgi:hypothetical protein